MQVRILGTISVFVILNCSAVKYNNHVAPDGSNGYLRTYYSSNKLADKRTDGTGIEQCKPQGSDVVCKDLNIIHAEDEFAPKAAPAQPAAAAQPVAPAPAAAKPAATAQPQPPAAKR